MATSTELTRSRLNRKMSAVRRQQRVVGVQVLSEAQPELQREMWRPVQRWRSVACFAECSPLFSKSKPFSDIPNLEKFKAADRRASTFTTCHDRD